MIRLPLLASIVLAVAAIGCGGSASLQGTVTFQGRPVVSGTVSVVSDGGLIAAGEIQPDGTYRIENCPRGKLKVAVSSPDPREVQKQMAALKDPARGQTGAPPVIVSADPAKWFALPAAYSDPDSSGITVDVGSGENKFDIILQ